MKLISRTSRAAFLAALGASVGFPPPGLTAEYGFSVYGLGGEGPLAGIEPPPGTYFDYAFIHGKFEADIVPARGRFNAALTATMNINAFTVQHVTDWKIFGANYGFRITVPYTQATLDGEVRNTRFGFGASTRDSKTHFGDIVVTPVILGWHEGAWHWQTYLSFVAPTGFYNTERLVFTGLNRWAIDFGGAITWLDPKIGFEASAQLGYTVNFKNNATDYLTGNEFHLEFFLGQHLPFGGGTISVGMVGYFYQQVTGDSGSGAVLGSFKGRTMALGPSLNFNSLNLGGPKVSVGVRYYKEFAVERRLAGETFLASFSFKF